jgi:large subunit ribosomal protein L10
VKREKQLLLDEMKEQMQQSGSFIIAQYQKMSGTRAHEFRRELAKIGGYFEVVRKRMFIEAAQHLGITFSVDQLPGHVGLVLGALDPIEASKVVLQFSDNNDKAMQLVGGFVEGQKTSAEDVQWMAKLPGKDQMRAELLGLLEAPASGLLGTMDAVLSGVVRVVDSKLNEASAS